MRPAVNEYLPIFKCDGRNDCYDDTEENYCEYNFRRLNVPAPFNFGDPKFYNDGGFDKNGCLPGFGICSLQNTCIPSQLFCDGKPDCFLHSDDERNCTGGESATLNPCKDKFVCSKNSTWDDQVCIQMEELCNGKKDCPLGDDESEKCFECSAKHCEHLCQNTPTGAKCVCKKGYRLASDGFSCVDLDECTLPERACHHFCENQVGSFVCSCAKGYRLKADKKSCESTKSSKGTFLLGVMNGIEGRPLDFSDTNFTSVYKTDGLFSTFDYLRRDQKIFMTMHPFIGKGGRLVVKEDGKPIKTLRENISHSYNLAVDWIGGNLFFTEIVRELNHDNSAIGRISVCTMDGKFCRRLIEGKELFAISAFAIHPMRGLIFYTDHDNTTTRIMMTNMDASQVSEATIIESNRNFQKQVLVETNSRMIRPLVIDYLKHDLYFGDHAQHNIQRVNIDTKKITVMDYKTYMHPSDAMTFHNGYLYRTEMHNFLQVMEVAREGSHVHTLSSNHQFMGMPLHMTVNDSLHQPEPSHNPCKELDCPWICVIVPDFTAKCLCPDGYTSSMLGTTCIPPSTETGERNNLPHIGLELMSEYCKTGVGCLNGGSCREVSNKTRIVCDCVDPYDGLYCERRKPILSDEAVLILILVAILLILLIAIGYGVYWFFFLHRRNKKDGVVDTISMVSKSTIGGAVYYENDAVSLG
ncbi:hypothetical protein CAEBREN_19512 [Caenorhabditis brenneri]|uniref:EGF-like domain-containing protein n=1 Tax=Caenorhabditis brenneri TaxID=135651 RepID=G0PFI1_CAEBE|nr:hypothetical protein CAEBREN_19512 [Caenorhabditis brenneri]